MNLANKITIARIFLIPLFLFFLLSNTPNGITISAFIFIIASLTDSLDGYIARSRNQVTKLGKFMDPLADKLLVASALIALVELGKIPAWIVIIIISREFIISVFRAIAAAEGIVIAASPWGKFKTISQLVAIISILFNNYPFAKFGIPFTNFAIWIALILTIISGVDYIIKNKAVLK